MTRSEILTTLRRRLQEVTEDNFSDTYLNSLINTAYQRAELDILIVNPEAYVSIYRADLLTTDPNLYQKPAGFLWESAFKLKNPDTGKYEKIRRIDYQSLLEISEGDAETCYAHFGDYFQIAPVPTTAIAAGIQLEFVPSLTMAADTDVPRIPLPLHNAIVLYAHSLCLGETGEAQERALNELQLIVNKIPGFYRKTAADEDEFHPDIGVGSSKYPS